MAILISYYLRYQQQANALLLLVLEVRFPLQSHTLQKPLAYSVLHRQDERMLLFDSFSGGSPESREA